MGAEAKKQGERCQCSLDAQQLKAWLKRKQKLLYKLSGQQNWLAMLQSDDELAQASGLSLEELKAKAAELLDGVADLQYESLKMQFLKRRLTLASRCMQNLTSYSD